MSFKKLIISAACFSTCLSFSTSVQASSEPFIGEIMPAGYNFCPRGFASTDGQLLPIAQNTALFSLIGTTYGGDGRQTFGLPDLRGRVPISRGRGPGLADYRLGQQGGSTDFTLTIPQMPSHNHTGQMRADAKTPANSNTPVRNSMGRTTGINIYSNAAPTNNMNVGDANILPAGGGQPMNKRSPYQTIKYCIATVGIFPSRS